MPSKFSKIYSTLHTLAYVYDPGAIAQKEALLASLSKLPWKNTEELNAYQEVLLFLAAHPESEKIASLTAFEFDRIARFFKQKKQDDSYNDLGFPFTTITTRFSHDLTQWLTQCKECTIEIDSFEEGAQDLNTLLKLSLPALERDETSAGLDNLALLDTLQVKPTDRLAFLLDQFTQFNTIPLTKDHLWESLKLWINVKGRERSFSRIFNRYPVKEQFYQQDILKKFDHEALLKKPLPPHKRLSNDEQASLAAVIKKSLLLTHRETDPATFMDLSTLRYYELERGISIAIYSMHGLRQLPLQSYVGYTLFKNGYPAAYGGSWVFGRRAMFGLNIFEAFRGGESGYMMCQLLRVYSRVFKLTHIEVEPYQFGLDNPDGIRSGAFWFYYRYGFLPLKPELKRLAEAEQKKIKTIKGYRSSENTLIQFTGGNIALILASGSPLRLSDVNKKVTRLVASTYQSNRSAALADSRMTLMTNWKKPLHFTLEEEQALNDMALCCAALKITDPDKLKLVREMVSTKPHDPYRYNDLLCEFLA